MDIVESYPCFHPQSTIFSSGIPNFLNQRSGTEEFWIYARNSGMKENVHEVNPHKRVCATNSLSWLGLGQEIPGLGGQIPV